MVELEMLTGNKHLIFKENGRIFVGGKEYNSATTALVAYVDIFKNGNCAGINKKPVLAYERKVGDLLLPKSCLQLTAERSLDCGIRDTPYEIQLYNQKKEIEKQHASLLSLSVAGDITSQAEQTIKETTTFLENLHNGCTSPVSLCCASDIGSLTTEYLISADPYPPKMNLIDRDPKGVCQKCGCYSVKDSKRTKQSISESPLDVLIKNNPLPLPINSSSPQNNSSLNVRKCNQSPEPHVINKQIYETPELHSKIKQIGEDEKKLGSDFVEEETTSQIEFRKVERLTCTKADWQSIDSFDKNSRVKPSKFSNCQNAKTKVLRKISNNAILNKSERTLLTNQSKTDWFPQNSSSGTNTRENTAKNKSPCKQNLSKSNLNKSINSETCKESAKPMKNVPKSKTCQECAVIKVIKSPQEDKVKQRASENNKQDTSNLQNSQKILPVFGKYNSQIPSSKKRDMPKSVKNQNKSKDIQHSSPCQQTDVLDFCASKNLDSLSLNSSNQHQILNKSIRPEAQEDQKANTSRDLSYLSTHKNPQVPNWVKELESSMVISRIDSPILPEEVSCHIPAEEISPSNHIKSWSISGIPFDSPERNYSQTSFSPRKDSDCKWPVKDSMSSSQELSQFLKNFGADKHSLLFEDYHRPQFHTESIQNLLDRYLNDQSKELSKLKGLDILTDDSVNGLSLESMQLRDKSGSKDLCDTHQSSYHSCTSCRLSPLSCEACLDDPCLNKSEEMLKFPFVSSTPNKSQPCSCFSKLTNPFWNDVKLQLNVTSDVDNQRRCMETLKNMLFRLQIEEESLSSLMCQNTNSLVSCQSDDQKVRTKSADMGFENS